MNKATLPAIMLSFALVGSDVLGQSAQDWPTYNHDVFGSRYNSGETALGPDNVAQLEEKWRFPAKDSGREIGVIHATPAVVDGYVYFGTVTKPAFYKLTPDGKVREARMEAISPNTDFSFDFQDLVLTPAASK